jgi:hypothetical protein
MLLSGLSSLLCCSACFKVNQTHAGIVNGDCSLWLVWGPPRHTPAGLIIRPAADGLARSLGNHSGGRVDLHPYAYACATDKNRNDGRSSIVVLAGLGRWYLRGDMLIPLR